jgi:hypothetical protein
MPAQVRRYVHRYFTEDSGMSTASEGEGRFRKVVLSLGPKGSAAAAAVGGERAGRFERAERGDDNVARSKADLTPIDWDNIPGLEKKNAECEVTPAAASKAADSVETNLSGSASGAQDSDNAVENCVLTAETTSCEDVAETAPIADPEPALQPARELAVKPDVPAHTNTGSGVADKPQE